MGLVRELPPQRGGGRPPAFLCGGGGPCRGHTAVPVALRRRCARRRAAWRACRTIGKAGAELGLMLGAFRRHPRPALLIVRMFHDIAWCAVSRRFSRPRPKIPARASRRLFMTIDLAGCTRCVRLPVCCTRTPVRRHTPSFVLLAMASTGSFLTTFSRAARGISRTPMVSS